MEILGPSDLIAQVRDRGICVACGGCADICPYHRAFRGRVATLFDCDRTQGQCYEVCPMTESDHKGLSCTMFDAPYDEGALGHYRSVRAARAGKKAGLNETAFQNGGTASALMMAALDLGLIDSAVLTGQEGIVPVPRKVTESARVLSCTGSKYMATPTLALLNRSIMAGGKRHGVVGTGCQMKSAAAMVHNQSDKAAYEDAIALTLGLFCTWALDTRRFLDYAARITDPETILSMDVPPPPARVFVIETTERTIEVPLDEIRPMIPEGCALCPDMTAQWADVSVGALEGQPGWNTLIVRSPRGEAWVEAAVDNGYLELGPCPADNLSQLEQGAGAKKERAKENLAKEDR